MTKLSETYKDFADWLFQKKNQSGLSYDRIAERVHSLGVERCGGPYLSSIANRADKRRGKKSRPRQEIVVALAEIFNEPVQELLILAGHVQAHAQNEETVIREITAYVGRLPRHVQRDILCQIQALHNRYSPPPDWQEDSEVEIIAPAHSEE